MSLSHRTLRKHFADFWEGNGHKEVPPIPLIPKDDPTTLFTGSGMQQLVPYLLGQEHPLGTRLYNIQPSFRAQDIEEVGDNRHDTFFEMMGNWSLGDYFKKEQIPWFYEFLTKNLSLPVEKLYVTVFEGEAGLPKDIESAEMWKKMGIPEARIFFYGGDKNWWSRGGAPSKMPVGEPGGPNSEVFCEFDVPHNPAYGKMCHPNCDCGRFSEIGNCVFMEYTKQKDGSFSKLPKSNVDFGGGLERLLAAANNTADIFTTDLYTSIITEVESQTGKHYGDVADTSEMRVIADHLKAAVFLIKDGVIPGNKEHGYILRRLLRRSMIKMYELSGKLQSDFSSVVRGVFHTYEGIQGIETASQLENTNTIIATEMKQFGNSLDRGLREIRKIDKIDGKIAFDFYQSYGFPLEITEELFRKKGQEINRDVFQAEFEKHRTLSRQSAQGRFKGGLADHSEQTVKYHTATHLLHQALFDVLGEGEVRQDGSNITTERLRFDFTTAKKISREDMKTLEDILNSKVNEGLLVSHKIIPREEAIKIGARAFFKEKYADRVKVYFIGDYSKEFCGGPHVENTKTVGKISIYKFERIGSNLYRIYAK